MSIGVMSIGVMSIGALMCSSSHRMVKRSFLYPRRLQPR
jgi:hypothetical protein